MISALRSIARRVTPLALDIFDKENTEGLLPVVSRVVPNPGKEKQGDLEWAAVYPQLRQWIGERTVQRAFTGTIHWVGQKYEITYEFDKNDAERESGLIKAEGMATDIGRAFGQGKVNLALRPLRENWLAYDGQDFFDVDHKQPDDSAYSNLLTIPRAVAAAPTVAEARAELIQAMYQLMRNRVLRNSVAESPQVANNLVVLTKSFPVWKAFEDLRSEESFGADKNRFKNAFRLLLDFAPKAGTETFVDFIWSDPAGPRPVLFVNTREPNGMQFDESKVFSHALIPFGMDGEYAFATGLPQSAVRVKQ